MALTAQPTAHAGWARWPQHHPGPDYVMMDSGMMSYDVRPLSNPPIQRPGLNGSYYTNGPLGPASITSVPAAPYQTPVTYAGYQAFTPSPVLGPVFKEERPQPRIIPAETEFGSVQSPSSPHEIPHRRVSTDRCRSPSIKSEAPSCRSTSSKRSGPRVITNNISANGTQIEFNTGVDTLMKALQSKADTEAILKKAEQGPAPSTEETKTEQNPQMYMDEKHRKVYWCDIPGCSKTFYQKTHLDIHRRAHTGDKPYMCKVLGCGQRFSQLGNLKTHERRHTGEKPYQCPQCSKRFAQRGNVRAHLKTHTQAKPFICKLDSCNKAFTQLGNLKSHQNRFHIDTLTSLTAKFASAEGYNSASREDKELWEYFVTLYKNSNKGIKGRGKHRRVWCINRAPSTSPITCIPPQVPSGMPHGLPQLHTPPPTHSRPPFHELSHPASFSLCRPNMLLSINREPHGAYDMFDTEEGSITSSAPSSTTTGPVYDEDQGRELAFGDRLY
ncbi:hypothetical protein QBC47DRAFT_396473 [Echria macrotheca]|uniref:C2H2-type domain-containing protein n=1 Tax=Echria macrotheca TaxID=438768 RepID=A0AAJ0F9P7_9PEZI|nr:hypothetical protein QBC47DRAFT_396473 [Echria macrotheca]